MDFPTANRDPLHRALDKNPELLGARRMAELAQNFGFDLADAFASDGEGASDFFEGVLAAVIEAKAHLDNGFLTRGESLEHRRHSFFQVQFDGGAGRGS